MALTATIYNFDIEPAGNDRPVYGSLALRVAQHPSESKEHLVARLLAWWSLPTRSENLTGAVCE